VAEPVRIHRPTRRRVWSEFAAALRPQMNSLNWEAYFSDADAWVEGPLLVVELGHTFQWAFVHRYWGSLLWQAADQAGVHAEDMEIRVRGTL
jgi:hypothetical protein